MNSIILHKKERFHAPIDKTKGKERIVGLYSVLVTEWIPEADKIWG